MNSRDRRPSFSLRAAAIACLLVSSAWFALATAASPHPRITEPVRAYDYYRRLTDAESGRAIQTAVEHHITEETFWAQYRRQAWFRARGELEFVLRIVPNHPLALYLLEGVAQAEEDVSYPIAYYERALRIFPERAITRAQYGRYLAKIGQREAGAAQLRTAIAADSTLLQARAWLHEVEAAGLPSTRGGAAPNPIDHAP